MSTPLTALYRKLSSKDQARIRRHIANPVLFLLEEYHDLSPAEQKKFKNSIGVDQKNKIAKVEVKETSTTKETTVAKESTSAKDTSAKDDSVAEVQNGIESMDLDGLAPSITQPSAKVETKAGDNQVVPYQAPSSETKVTPKSDAIDTKTKDDSTDTDEDPEPEAKYNSDEDQDYAEDPEDEEGEDEY